MYRLAADRYGDRPAFATRLRSGVYRPVSYRDLYDFGLYLGTALIEFGLEAREHVGLLSDNRVEWNIVDYGTLLIGAADVPRGSDVTSSEIEYILNHCDARVVFVEIEFPINNLTVKAGEDASYLDNIMEASKYSFQKQLDKLGKPVDRTEWGMRTAGEGDSRRGSIVES